jgi:hypothetical protein
MEAAEWDRRYAEARQWSIEPNRAAAELITPLPPGRARSGVDDSPRNSRCVLEARLEEEDRCVERWPARRAARPRGPAAASTWTG